ARGFLAGTRARQQQQSETPRGRSDNMDRDYYFTDADFAILERVQAMAAEHGVKPAQIALAWMLHQPGITSPIVGVTKMPQLEDAIGALDIRLSADERAHLEALYQPKPVMGHR
ncbi:MAG: aldo/keto reductase, partial [Phototrophicaceae bacterium]